MRSRTWPRSAHVQRATLAVLLVKALLVTGACASNEPTPGAPWDPDTLNGFLDGLQHGTWHYHFDTGELLRIIHFDRGLRHGEERTFYRSGQLLKQGTWYRNLRHGTFVQFGHDGAELGSFEMVHGTGVHLRWWNDGTLQRVEEHVDGERHGRVHVYEEDGLPSTEHRYAHGQRNGEAVYWERIGDSVYRQVMGVYRESRRHGTWTWYHEGGEVAAVQEYREGRLHGSARRYQSDGTLVEDLHFRDGRRHGDQREYHPDGTLAATGHYRNGLRQGEHRRFHPDGTLAETGYFRDGLRHGEQRRYFPDGRLHQLVPWDDGLIHGALKVWYENRQQERVVDFERDIEHGRYHVWFENGQPMIETSTYGGHWHGYYIEYGPDGDVLLEGEMVMGEPSGIWYVLIDGVPHECEYTWPGLLPDCVEIPG